MLKNNKGVTLTVLVVTIIVIIILAGVTIASSDSLIKNTKVKNMVTNMYLIQAKAEALYEEYQFNGTMKYNNTTINGYVGVVANSNDLSSCGVTAIASDKWYKWDKNTIKDLGFDENMLSSGGDFIVNYATGEVIYTKGLKDDDGNVKYTLTDLTN